MKLLRYWKIVAGLVLVFAAGVVTGIVVTHQMVERGIDKAMNFENWKAGVMHVLQSKLNLTPEQHQKIGTLLDERGQEIRSAFYRTFDESGRILVQLQHQVDHELTPAQCAIHAEMKKDFREHLKKRFNFDLPPE